MKIEEKFQKLKDKYTDLEINFERISEQLKVALKQ